MKVISWPPMLGLRHVLLLCVLLGGCLESKASQCADGSVCPAGLVCHAQSSSCADPAQVASCLSEPPSKTPLADGAECVVSGVTGSCNDGLCVVSTCGDRVLTPPERCEPDLALDESLTCSSLGFHEGVTVSCTDVCTLDISDCEFTCGDGDLYEDIEECEQGFPGPDRNCTELAGGDVFDVGLQLCSSLCSLREDNCQRYGWDRTDIPIFSGTATLRGFWISSDNEIFALGHTSPFFEEFAVLQRLTDGDWVHAATDLLPSFPSDGAHWGMWGTTSSDLWYGFAGGVAHWDGASTTLHSFIDLAGDPADVVAISGVASDAIFATTKDNLFRYNGTEWTHVEPTADAANDIYALDANRVLIVGNSSIQVWNGTSFESVLSGGPYPGIHGFSPNDIWVIEADEEGTSNLLHFDGLNWSTKAIIPQGISLRDITGDDTRAFAVGTRGTTYYFNGAHWSHLAEPRSDDEDAAQDMEFAICSGDTLLAFGGANRNVSDAWLWRGFDVRTPTQLTEGVSPSDIWVQDPTNWVVVGGSVSDSKFFGQHFDGSIVTSKELGINGPATAKLSVWGSAINDVYVVGGDGRTLSHYNGIAWTPQEANLEADSFTRIHGSSATNIWAVGTGNTISRYNGNVWSAVVSPPSGETDNIFSAVYAESDSFALVGSKSLGAGDDGKVFIWDGATWTLANLDPAGVLGDVGDIVDIAGSSPDNIWVLTELEIGNARVTRFFHYDHINALWNADFPHPGGEQNFHRLVVLAPDEAFAISSNGKAAHFDGEGWATLRIAEKGLLAVDGIDGTLVGVGVGEVVRQLDWTRRWSCKSTETNCANRIDDDCDGRIDGENTEDCP
jgi:hypothetical protein